MATLTGIIVADFTTTLATAISIGGTTATLSSATDDDGVALPTGRYFFTLDGSNSSKEHISCTLTGTALTNIKTVSRQGVETAGVLRVHRIGASVSITDFAHILQVNNLVNGTTDLNSADPLKYDAAPTFTYGQNQLVTYDKAKDYTDGVAIAGAPNGDTTTKGIFEEATQAEVLAKTTVGGTGADLVVNPSTLASTLLSDYKADTGAANAYVITPSPAITAYTAGQIFSFKATNANTTTSTLNVNGLGVKTINKLGGATALVSGDIAAGMIVVVEYDGTNFVMLNPVANVQPVIDIQTFTSNGTWTKPAGAKKVLIQGWGAGGAGGGAASSGLDGGGGGGGAYKESWLDASGLTSTVAVSIGTGGTGVSNGNGNIGGNTTFASYYTVYGGGGGGVYAAAPGAGGGGGGQTSAGTSASGATAGIGGSPIGGAAKASSVFGGAGGGNSTGSAGVSYYGGGGGNEANNGGHGGGAGGYNNLYGAGGTGVGPTGTVGGSGTNGALIVTTFF